ncbi:MAG TPA: Do family serine endopeptidase [Terracidiphilus sp.]|nr:Do family serine endopeptidase [Terracidiphilus sp.]
MKPSTNSLVARARKLAVPLGTVAALLFAASFFLFDHDAVKSIAAQQSQQAQISDSSIAPLTSLNDAVEAVVNHVMPAVVNVSVTARVPQGEGGGGHQFGGINPNEIPPEFRQFFGGGQQQQPQFEYGIGSGFIISPDGYIVTNHHVVNDAKSIQVTLHDRRTFPAKVVGVDKLDDLAVIKIDASNLPTISWGDSAGLKPGEAVMAFGNPFGELTFSVTRGIVSAVHRSVNPGKNNRTPRDYIQTDAAINPGNSGGPLVDARGQVIGIDTFIFTSSGSFAGAGFAIPANLAQHSVNEIIKTGKVEHGFLGIGITNVDPQNAKFFNVPTASGALVNQVNPDTPASSAGFKQGDVVRTVNGKNITDATDLQVQVSEMAPGTPITLGILRDGKPMTLHATVGQYHAPAQQGENAASGKSQHARLGISVQDLNPDLRQQLGVPDNIQGVAVQSVQQGGPSDQYLAPGEVIMQVNRKPVTSAQSFLDQVRNIPADQSILLLVWDKQGGPQGGTIYRVIPPAGNLNPGGNNDNGGNGNGNGGNNNGDGDNNQ